MILQFYIKNTEDSLYFKFFIQYFPHLYEPEDLWYSVYIHSWGKDNEKVRMHSSSTETISYGIPKADYLVICFFYALL